MLFRRGKKISFNTRATLGGLMIAVAALWALTVSYEITWWELFGYLAGSVAILLLAMACAIALLVIFKLLRRAMQWLLQRLTDD